MTIMRWNPLREMAAMQSAMDRIFNDTWRNMNWNESDMGAFSLPIDVHETDKDYTVTTDLPGVNPDDIHVKFQDGMLLIEAELPEQKEEQDGQRALMKERRYGKFTRAVRLPQQVNAANVEAAFHDGVLTLTLPKAEEVQPRLIPVKTNGNNKK